MTPEAKTTTSWPPSGDNSFEEEDMKMGMGRGKPMSALAGKRKRMGLFARPRAGAKPDWSPTGASGSSTPVSIIDKKRSIEMRRRGRQPKMRGMVGLQRPTADPSAKDDPEEDSKMVCVAVNDKFVLEQDLCVMCGAVGTDLEGRLIACAQCGECYHPHCINVRVTKVILQKGWRCLDCTVCEGCGLKHDEANIILCDECDISYHIYCMSPPLESVPTGTWKCKWCAVCHQCGTSDPGVNSKWYENYSLCGVCHSLQVCLLCDDGYEDGDLIMNCATCKRWTHGECDSINSEEDAEKCAQEGYTCRLCRPPDVSPPHLASKQTAYGNYHSREMSSNMSEYSSYSHYNSASFIVDGVILSERGMTTLKSQTIEREKARRRKRGLGEGMYDSMEAPGGPGDDDNDNDDDDDIPPPTPGGPPGLGPKDGDIVRPMPDGRPPDAPDGFTVVQKDNGLMVLRKRRYRDLKKVGIGGFQAKQRTPSRKPKDEPEVGPDGEKPKKRPAWRPKKNKLLVQYPEYIQDAFFGKETMDALDQNKNPEDFLEESLVDPRQAKSPEKSKLRLNKDILSAIDEIRAKEEKEKKAKEAAAAKLKSTEDKKAEQKNEVKEITKDEKVEMEDELPLNDDDLLPSDIFGDDLFKNILGAGDPSGVDELGDIDDQALEEAEKADEEENKGTEDSKESSELADALGLGPGFKLDTKEMEDLFSGMIDEEANKETATNADTNATTSTTVTQSATSDIQPNTQPPQQSQPQATMQQNVPPMPSMESQAPQNNTPTTPTASMPIPSMQVSMPSSTMSMTPATPNQAVPPMFSQQQQQQQQPMPNPTVMTRPQMTPQMMNTQMRPPGAPMVTSQDPRMMVNPQQQQQQQIMQQQQQQQLAMQQRQEQLRAQMQPPQQPPQQPQMVRMHLQQQQQGQIGQTQMTPVLLRQQQPQQPFGQPQPQVRFQNTPPPITGTPFPQTEYHTPAALQGPSVQLPNQPQPPPQGATWPPKPNEGPMMPPNPQGPPVGAVPPPASITPPQPPKAPTPETSSTTRNQLLKWESDEPLGANATIAMILYSNQNHPNLKSEYPIWADRIKQIGKIWKNLPNDKRQPYVQQARENRTASRMKNQVRIYLVLDLPANIIIIHSITSHFFCISINLFRLWMPTTKFFKIVACFPLFLYPLISCLL